MSAQGKGKSGINYSFYEGIDEALALLRLGLECVSLWHCFDKEVPTGLINQYESTTSSLIRTLNLPINYRGLFLEKYQDEVQAYPISEGKPLVYVSADTGERAMPVIVLYGKVNPLKDTTEAKRVLEFLRMFLKIPSV